MFYSNNTQMPHLTVEFNQNGLHDGHHHGCGGGVGDPHGQEHRGDHKTKHKKLRTLTCCEDYQQRLINLI